jgi:hypothetical protein
MQKVVRAVVLILSSIVGLWSIGNGIHLVASLTGEGVHEDVVPHLIEGSIAIAGGVCVLSVAMELLSYWRTHHKDGGVM